MSGELTTASYPHELKEDGYADTIKMLEKKLEEAQRNVQQFEEIRMVLLEENNNLKTRTDMLSNENLEIIEILKSKLHSQEMQLKNKILMESAYIEEIAHYKDDIAKQKVDLEAKFLKEATELRKWNEQLNEDLEQSQENEKELHKTLTKLQELVKEQENVVNISQSFVDNDFSDQQQKALLNENTGLRSSLIKMEMKEKELEIKIIALNSQLSRKQQEIEEFQRMTDFYQVRSQNSRLEIQKLKEELDDAVGAAAKSAMKGNSLFSEVEDRRIAAEKKIKSLMEQLSILKEKYELERQQHHDLKVQMVSMLQMNAVETNSALVQHLQCKLIQTQDEVNSLQDKVYSYKKSEQTSLNQLVEIKKTFGEKSNKNYIGFLNSLLKTKNEEIEKLTLELRNKELLCLDESNKTMWYASKLQENEEETKKYRLLSIKAMLKTDELLMKFDQGELKAEKNIPKTKLETIPLDSVQLRKNSQHIEARALNTKKPGQTVVETDENKSSLSPSVLFAGKSSKKTVCILNGVSCEDTRGNNENVPATPVKKKVNSTKMCRRMAPVTRVRHISPSDSATNEFSNLNRM